MCLAYGLPDGLPDPGVPCCDGAAAYGPRGCTCWETEYDRPQAQPDTGLLPLPPVPLRMCATCAYRPGSPERAGDPAVAGDPDMLEELAVTGQPFWCHQGMRLGVRLRHPSGLVYEIPGTAHYQPPIVAGVPYKADGTPGDLCAGWLLRRAALTRTGRAADAA